MGDTAISWTHRPGTVGKTWNPTQGCRIVSEGCRNCYAMRTAKRFSGPGKPFEGLVNIKTGKWTGKVEFPVHKLADPLSWRAPATVFVNSMSDLFYEKFTNEQIAAVFGVMAATPRHTYQILTKRAKRMREWFEWVGDHGARGARAACRVAASDRIGRPVESQIPPSGGFKWPLPNAWIGVSIENQEAADGRIPELLNTPAAVRFLSCEPLLGSLDLRRVRPRPMPIDALTGGWSTGNDDHRQENRVHWVIVGAESGPGARKCDQSWIRSIRDQCKATGTPMFLKQAVCELDERPPHVSSRTPPGFAIRGGPGSKKKGNGLFELPYLDGVQHAAFPVVP